MVAAWGDSVLLFGGIDVESGLHSDDTWMFNGQRGTWTPLSEMPEPRAAGAVVVVDDLFYLVGGTGGSNRVLRYDPTQDAWRRLSELDGAREFPAAVALEGRIYVIGGRDESGRDLASTLAYEIAADRFEPAPSMRQARSMHAAVVFEGRLVALGGEPKTGTRRLTSIESWQPGESVWHGAGTLPGELTAIAAAAAQGRLYVMGDSLRATSRQPAAVLVSATHGSATPRTEEVQ
jgi:large repetitive protein